jgi:tetratricopeptide (TPR) repeat protein
MANISSQFKKASELYQRALQQYQAKEKQQVALINQFKTGDVDIKAKLKPQLIALHKEMQYHQELVDRAEAAFEKALVSEPVNLGEDTIVKNKKTGNVYSVKKANPAIHTKPSAKDIAQAKADNGGDIKAEPTKGPELDVDKQSHIKDIPQKFRSMVSMKIDQLAKAAAEAKAKGEKAPNFNLCDITIPGTNLYCKGNKGIPREDMPQFKGYAKPGSIADKLPKNSDGEVDTEAQFKVLLKRNGVAVSEPQEVPADQLKATQTELVGAKVAGMTKALETEPNHPKITAPIYVSNDGYVLDGHHRWAAVTSAAVASGKPAMMNVRVIDMPIKDLVKISNDFADQIGIQQKKADANAEAPKKEVAEVTTNDWHFKKILQMWDKANSFGKKRIATVICRDPKATRNDIIAAMRDTDYEEITDFTDKLHIENVVTEDTDTSNIIKDLDKVRHDLIKKVDVLISKKKKLYANVDITTPMSADEKQLDKDIQSIFSQIQSIIQQKRKIKTENVVVEDKGTEADESGMAKSEIKTAIEAATNIQAILNSKGEEFDVPAWVQSYLALASDYLHSINEYYKGIENK